MTNPNDNDSRSTDPQLAEVTKQLEEARAKAAEHLEGWKRAKADYSNLKRESEIAGANIAQFAVASVLQEILPVADNLDRAVRHVPEELAGNDWVKGVLGIREQLAKVLQQSGIEAVAVEGSFDPQIHEAVAQEEREGAKSGTILEVLEQGYTLRGKLLRPAKVKVAK